jgi:SAM-dependent methyltransferase
MARINILRVVRGRWRSAKFDPASYWESRAPDLIHGYDHPETWEERNWLSAGQEEVVVPRLLHERSISSVPVVGAGTGRQYDFLKDFEVRGFDLSQKLVDVARSRHPEIDTAVDDLMGAEERQEPADAVLVTAVLQHVPPKRIADAIRSLTALARRLIILREAVRLAASSSYQSAHDYDLLFPQWDLLEALVAGETDQFRTELRALSRAEGHT